MSDVIFVEKLELGTYIGVTEQERAQFQRVTASLVIEPAGGVVGLRDRVHKAVDYDLVCSSVQELAAKKPRNLLETLAEEIAALLLRRFPVDRVQVELHKYIMADAVCVGVRIERDTNTAQSIGLLR